MSLAGTLHQFLADKGIQFQIKNHPPTWSSSQSAQASHVSGKAVAKAVVLKDDRGFLLAVLPASRRIQLERLRQLTQRRLALASEDEISALFGDCQKGAVPALGQAYGLPVVMDDSLTEQPEIYFEGGDHLCLLRVSEAEFEALMGKALRGAFSQ